MLPLLPLYLGYSADRVIIISRHGVRRQFPSAAFNFSLYAPGKQFDTSDAAWGAAGGEHGSKAEMGVLTQHGYDAVERMGAYQSQRYMSLVPECKGAYVYCEENMPRDAKTAEAFFKGLGCETTPSLHSEGAEYLIDQGSKPRGDDGECALGTQAQVEGRVGGSVDEYLRLYMPRIRKLSELLGCCDASLCGKPAGSKCSLEDLPSAFDQKHWYTTFSGPMYAGKYFAEWIELTMLNGMDFAWGKLTVEEVMELSAFVTQYREFEFDMLAARPFGSALLAHVGATLHQWAAGAAQPAVTHAASERLVYYAAHDTNLLYLAELLELKWLAKGWQPNHTPPGGMLVIEALAPTNDANPTGEWQLAVFFDVQTPQQVRELTRLSDDAGNAEATKPSRVPVTVPGCSVQLREGGPLLCPLPSFLQLVGRTVRAECIGDQAAPASVTNLRAFAEGLGGATAGGIPLSHAAMAVCSIATMTLCLGLAVGRIVQRRLHTREQRLIPSREIASGWSSDSDINVPPLRAEPL